MWEKIKNSRFAEHVRNSRAIYVTILTLILALSVLITVTAISNRAKKNNSENDTPPNQNAGQEDNDRQDEPNHPNNGNNSGTDSKPDHTQNNGGTQTANTVPEMALPVVGPVNKGYDSAVQVYSPTMGDYRIHLGLDMNAKEAAPVLAAADGVISQIWDDPMMGKCVAISHSGDCYTIYKNLDATLPNSVTVGSKVKAGECIGNVGQSALLELAEEPHLHFEMTVAGLSVDPMEYFSEQAMAQLSEAKDVTEASTGAKE